MKRTFKHLTPEPVWRFMRNTGDALMRLPELPRAYLHPWRVQSIRNLKSMHNRHYGERCFIIGNGPSLRRTDLRRLRGEATFGANRIYLLFAELGFETTYLVLINDLVIEQCLDEILSLSMPKFLAWRSHGHFRPDLRLDAHKLNFLYTSYTGPGFGCRAERRLWEGATVTYISLQLAFHMGFKKVILIGVDHNFNTKGEANQTVVSQGDDPNHFDPDYFGRGFRWQLPDLDTSERAYSMARQAYEVDGRHIVDATVGGKLNVFPKVDFNSLFE